MSAKRRMEPYHIAAAVLLVLAVLSVGKTLFAGLEIDEQYALSIGWRLVKGDTLFYTMWEPHQLSALPAAVLLWLFYTITGGTTGVLLFVRAVMVLAKAGLSIWFYRTMRPKLSAQTALLVSLALFVYTPKWFLGPDYISQQFHFTLAAFLCFYGYIDRGCRGLWRMVPGGICLSLSVLAFPQSAFAAPVYLIGLFLLGRRSGERRLAGIPVGTLAALATCCLCAAVFLWYVLRDMSLAMLLSRAELILNDPQYDFSTGERLALLAGQAADVLRFLSKPGLVALAAVLAGILRDISRRHQQPIRNIRFWLNLFFALFCGLAMVLCLVRAVRDASLDERYFVPVLAVAGLWFFRHSKNTSRSALFWLGYLPGVVAYLFILRSTLLGLSATFMYLTWPGLCALLALALQSRAAGDGDAPGSDPVAAYALDGDWADGLLLLFLAFLVVCRCFLILTTGWKPRSVLDTPMELLTDGPAAFTWVDVPTADMYHALEQALAPYAGQQVLLSTGDVEGLAFLMDGGSLQVGQASVISSTDSDPRFASYYLELPEKAPDVILYNNNCVRDLEEFHGWLEEHFVVESRQTVTCGTASLEVLTVDPADP
ncbi:hypothetical protein [uncultured Gemmiger sp.]|uniref:hypothetical protein n=1 Tax=uncultured Gemmiger sp. TaxID=1623490 RepID=UPI0025D6CF04|nr:hypothetical protein [uncultured Gemmiger sp.]